MVHRTAIDLRLSLVKCCRATVPRAKQTMELKLMKLRRKGKKKTRWPPQNYLNFRQLSFRRRRR